MRGQDRPKYGCILSFENADGRTLVLHRTGAIVPVVRALCDEARALDDSFRVVAYSTPETVLSDMDGGRMPYENYVGRSVPTPMPERTILTRAGRSEMLHARLRP